MNRTCPGCARKSLPVSSLILSRADCPHCGTPVGVRRIWAALFFILTFAPASASFIAILAQQGIYAALIFLPLPIAAVGYIKARYCPLQSRSGPLNGAGSPSGGNLL